MLSLENVSGDNKILKYFRAARWVRGYQVKSAFSCVESSMLTDLGSVLRRGAGQAIPFSKGNGAQLGYVL